MLGIAQFNAKTFAAFSRAKELFACSIRACDFEFFDCRLCTGEAQAGSLCLLLSFVVAVPMSDDLPVKAGHCGVILRKECLRMPAAQGLNALQ
jgi:hypothetical protein